MTKEYNPMDKYTLDLYRVEDQNKEDEEVTRFFWHPNPLIILLLGRWLQRLGIRERIIDIGCGSSPFSFATHFVDFTIDTNTEHKFKVDLDFELFPQPDKYFHFIYCRHTLEDIQNPQHAFKEYIRISKAGYIETPSPLIELLRGVDAPILNPTYRGYLHHRYIVWSDFKTHTIHFLPKYPIIEHKLNDEALKKVMYIANNYPVYWNNYYIWDETTKPNIIVYRHGVNMNIEKDYIKLLNQAINSSMEYTDHFITYLSDRKTQ